MAKTRISMGLPTYEYIRQVLKSVADWTASRDGSVESAENALAEIQALVKEPLSLLGVLVLDPNIEEAKCVCGFDFFEAEVEVMPGCKCRKCNRVVYFIGG